MLSVQKAQVPEQAGWLSALSGILGSYGSQSLACPSWPTGPQLQCPHPTMLLQVQCQPVPISSLSETSPGSNLHGAQARTWLFSLHLFWSFKSLPSVTARPLASDLESWAFATDSKNSALNCLCHPPLTWSELLGSYASWISLPQFTHLKMREMVVSTL